MFGNVTALKGLHVTGNYRDRSMQHTCSRHAAWDPHTGCVLMVWHLQAHRDVEEGERSKSSQEKAILVEEAAL